MKYLLATRNQGKLHELQAVLQGFDIQLENLAAFEDLPDAVEDGRSFRENARKKALHYTRLTRLPTIADDSGLSVRALQGRPGVHSARFAPTDPERIRKLLWLLRHLDSESKLAEREAKFVCALCLAYPEGELIEVSAEVAGWIARKPKGSHGFGYDPVFYYPPSGKTFAEMSPEEKNRVSHRALALRKLRRELERRRQ